MTTPRVIHLYPAYIRLGRVACFGSEHEQTWCMPHPSTSLEYSTWRAIWSFPPAMRPAVSQARAAPEACVLQGRWGAELKVVHDRHLTWPRNECWCKSLRLAGKVGKAVVTQAKLIWSWPILDMLNSSFIFHTLHIVYQQILLAPSSYAPTCLIPTASALVQFH